MRTLRLAMEGTVILALLAGVSGAVLAQDEEAPSELPTAPVIETGAVGEATVWHRLNPDGPEHERLSCSEPDGTLSCDGDKVEELDFAWDAGTTQFNGDEVTASWACPAWFPVPVCDGVVSVWSGTMRYQPVEQEAVEVPQGFVFTDVDGQPQLWLQFTDWALACPWYGTFEEALAAGAEYEMDCVSGA